MRGRFSGADDPSHLFARIGGGFRPCVNDEDRYRTNHPDCLPTVAVGVWIVPRQRKGVVKDKLRSFKTDFVIDFVRAILFGAPRPLQASPPM